MKGGPCVVEQSLRGGAEPAWVTLKAQLRLEAGMAGVRWADLCHEAPQEQFRSPLLWPAALRTWMEHVLLPERSALLVFILPFRNQARRKHGLVPSAFTNE